VKKWIQSTVLAVLIFIILLFAIGGLDMIFYTDPFILAIAFLAFLLCSRLIIFTRQSI